MAERDPSSSATRNRPIGNRCFFRLHL
jgi:hypothetical protein